MTARCGAVLVAFPTQDALVRPLYGRTAFDLAHRFCRDFHGGMHRRVGTDRPDSGHDFLA
jgi:hypothetical protein